MKAVLIILAWLALVALIIPSGAFPLFDDWVYSWAAKHLAANGQLALPELSAAYPVFQIFWGAVFLALPLGPDLALRVSTLVLAGAGAWAWYALLRRCGRGERVSLLIVAAGLSNPVYVVLAPTFMTDVAFVALCQLALLAMFMMFTGQRGAQWPWLLVCTALVLAAGLTRQPGIALGLGLAAAAFGSKRTGPALAALAAVVLVLGGQRLFTGQIGGALPLTERFADLAQTLSVSPLFYLDGLTTVLAYMGLSAAPLAFIRGRPDVRLWTLAALWLALAWFAWGPPVLRSGTVWGVCELGGARSLLSGAPPVCGWETPVRIMALLLASAGLAALGSRLPGLVRRVGSALRAREPFITAAALALLTMAVGLLALWMFADRYWLLFGLLAPALVVGRGQDRPTRSGMAAACLLIAVYLGTGLVGAKGSFDFFRSAHAAAAELAASDPRGAAVVDAGYAVNAELRYLVMPPAAGGQGRNASVAWVSAVAVSPLTVANRVEPGWRLLRPLRGGLVVVERP